MSMRARTFSSSDVTKSKALTPNMTRLHSASMIAACREDCPDCCWPCSTMPSSKPASTNITVALSHSNATGWPGRGLAASASTGT